MTRMEEVAAARSGGGGAGQPAPAWAAWPEQTITLVVPYTPGTGIDLVARQARRPPAEGARPGGSSSTTSPGASGNIGSERRRPAPKPDGYTLLVQGQHARHEQEPVQDAACTTRSTDFAPVAQDLVGHAAAGDEPGGAEGRLGRPGHRGGEGASGPAHVRHAGQRHAAPPGDGAAAAEDRHRDAARAVPGHRPAPSPSSSAAGSTTCSCRCTSRWPRSRPASWSRWPPAARSGAPAGRPDARPRPASRPATSTCGTACSLRRARRPRSSPASTARSPRSSPRPDVASAFETQGMVPAHTTPAAFGELIAKDAARWAEVVRNAKITAD